MLEIGKWLSEKHLKKGLSEGEHQSGFNRIHFSMQQDQFFQT